MSAFVVSKDHIDAMIDVALHGPSGSGVRSHGWFRLSWYAHRDVRGHSEILALHRVADRGNADAIGQMLVDENVASIRHCYAGSDPEQMIPVWTRHFTYPIAWMGQPRRRPTALEALKMIDCYEYQACEHPDWETSEARQFCEALRGALIHALPGYDAADGWEWTNTAEGNVA